MPCSILYGNLTFSSRGVKRAIRLYVAETSPHMVGGQAMQEVT